jgi:hypothetical protein
MTIFNSNLDKRLEGIFLKNSIYID